MFPPSFIALLKPCWPSYYHNDSFADFLFFYQILLFYHNDLFLRCYPPSMLMHLRQEYLNVKTVKDELSVLWASQTYPSLGKKHLWQVLHSSCYSNFSLLHGANISHCRPSVSQCALLPSPNPHRTSKTLLTQADGKPDSCRRLKNRRADLAVPSHAPAHQTSPVLQPSAVVQLTRLLQLSIYLGQ